MNDREHLYTVLGYLNGLAAKEEITRGDILRFAAELSNQLLNEEN